MKKQNLAAFAALLHAGILCGFAATADENSKPPGNASADDTTVITVTKHTDPANTVGSAFSKIGSDEIQRTQLIDLSQSVNTTPGAFANESGGRGAVTLLDLRGNRDDHTLILLDGVRLNTSIFQTAQPFLDFAGTGDLQSIEIVRGPQSTLYGSESIGGVVSMQTRRGEGPLGATIFGEAGSFNSFREGFRAGGAFDHGAFTLSYERDDTDNARPNNRFDVNRYSLRLDYDVTDTLSMQLNVHGHIGRYEEPGSVRPQDLSSNDPNSHTDASSNLVSLIVNWKTTSFWTQKLTLGAYFERYVFNDPAYAGNFFTPTLYIGDAANYTVDWQNDFQIAHNNRLTAGVEFDLFRGHDNTFADHQVENWAGYVLDEWEPVKNLFLTGGARFDSYQIGGDATTYRLTGAYLISKTDTKLRASYGTAFKAPNFFQMFSTSSFALGDPNLKPEKSRGWDAGVDQYFLDKHITLGASYFENRVRDLIAFNQTGSFTGDYINRDHAHNHGIELSAVATLFDEWKTRLAYTYTDSTVSMPAGTQRSDYVPRNVFSLDTSYRFFHKLTLGCGVLWVAGRVGTDYSTFPATQVKLSDYYTLRVYSRYEVNDHFAVFLRGENLTGAHYQTTLGFPALPLGIFGGAEIHF